MTHRLRVTRAFPAIAIAIQLWGASTSILAQAPATSAWTEDSIHSARLSGTRRLRIALPEGYSQRINSAQRYPVVIAMGDDDDESFAAIVHSVRRLTDHAAWALPPLIIVGVGRGNLGRDAYPPASGGMSRARPTAGGVEGYTAFLASELLPWVGAHFRTMPFTVLAGHSAWGHAAIYAYAHAPESFTAAVAVSPALWWLSDDANDDAASRDYADRIAKRTAPGRLFVGFGAFDPGSIVKGVDRFAGLVRKDASSFEYRRYPQDSHNSTVPDAFVDGLRWVFQPVSLASNGIWPLIGFDRVDSTALARAYAETKQRYVEGARALGFPQTLPADFLGFMAAVPPGPGPRTDVIPIAATLCRDLAIGYPAIPESYVCLADVLLRQADTVGARRELNAALAVARRDAWPAVARRLERRIAELDSASGRKSP